MKRVSFRKVAALVFAAALCVSMATAAGAQLRKGTKAPEFRLKSVTGKMMSLSQIRKDPQRPGKNRVVVLDFWATYCEPCKMEFPIFQKLQRKYGKDGLVVVGIACDREGMSLVAPFVKAKKLGYTVLVDPNMVAKSAYRVRFYPTTFIIDRSGIIRAVHVGYTPEVGNQLEADIKPLL